MRKMTFALLATRDVNIHNNVRNQGDFDLAILAAILGMDYHSNPRPMGATIEAQLK